MLFQVTMERRLSSLLLGLFIYIKGECVANLLIIVEKLFSGSHFKILWEVEGGD